MVVKGPKNPNVFVDMESSGDTSKASETEKKSSAPVNVQVKFDWSTLIILSSDWSMCRRTSSDCFRTQ